jgi:hypothetical protein
MMIIERVSVRGSKFRVVESGVGSEFIERISNSVDVFEVESVEAGRIPVGLRVSWDLDGGSWSDVRTVRSDLRAALLDVGGFDSVEVLGSGIGRVGFLVESDGVRVVLKYEFDRVSSDGNSNEVRALLSVGGSEFAPRLFGWGARWVVVEFLELGAFDGVGSVDLGHGIADIESGFRSLGVRAIDLNISNLRRRASDPGRLVCSDLGHFSGLLVDADAVFDFGVIRKGVVVRTDSGGVELD